MRLTRARILFALLAATPLWTDAQPATPSARGETDLVATVLEAPALAAAARRAEAARERVDAAGRLADIEVEGMGSRMNGPMGERATMWELNARQPLPKRGERAADRERARAGVALARADYALMAAEMSADTAMALAEAEGARARIRLLETQIARLDAALRSVDARIAAGSGRIADRLTVQSRLASMQLMIEEEEKAAADALAAARGLLGLPPEAPLPVFSAPAADQIRIDEAAALQLAAARGDEAVAMAKLARASANPMTSVGLRYEHERRAMGDENTVGLTFMSELPFRSRRYARAEVRAAEAERAAAETDADAARYRISAALTRVDRAERLAGTARRLSGETVARLQTEYEAMVATAGAGSSTMGASILELVELLEKSTDAELQVIRAETAALAARAELWRYMPADHFLSRAGFSPPSNN